MQGPRKKIPALTQKKILAECMCRCPFCGESDVATFEFHHIDENPSNNDSENLVVACSSCHSKIVRGIISKADVVTKKRQLFWTDKPQLTVVQPAVNVQIQGSSFSGDIAQHITKISIRKPLSKVLHPPGSIGANLPMKGYVDYLIGRYFQYRKADRSYGRVRQFSYAVIHRNIEKQFGGKTFFLQEGVFNELVNYLLACIDRTIQGRNNQARGIPNYHSFQEHCVKHKLSAEERTDKGQSAPPTQQ